MILRRARQGPAYLRECTCTCIPALKAPASTVWKRHNSVVPLPLLHTVVDQLQHRGMLSSMTSQQAIHDHLRAQTTTVYLGVDPSARSLHAGNLVALMGLLHFVSYGHNAIALIGGATGSIGDPSGRSTERNALSREELDANVAAITRQLTKFIAQGTEYVKKQERLQSESIADSFSSKSEKWSGETELGQRQNTLPLISKSDSTLSQSNPSLTGRASRDKPQGSIKIMNNLEWLGNMNLLEFLGSVGRLTRMGSMLSRERIDADPAACTVFDPFLNPQTSVSSRLDSRAGMSFTEFSYQLLQGYDFWYLNKHHDVTIQLGGSDQLGNIMTGVDLILRTRTIELERATAPSGSSFAEEKSRPEAIMTADEKWKWRAEKCTEKDVDDRLKACNQSEAQIKRKSFRPGFGITLKLLTDNNGDKFGKSVGKPVWLDPELTTSYEFYQFFLRTSDQTVIEYLKYFTFIPMERIERIKAEVELQPELRTAQKLLAAEVTELIHGPYCLEQAIAASSLFHHNPKSADSNTLDIATLVATMDAKDPSLSHLKPPQSMITRVKRDDFIHQELWKLPVITGLAPSRNQVARAKQRLVVLAWVTTKHEESQLDQRKMTPSNGEEESKRLEWVDLYGHSNSNQAETLKEGNRESRQDGERDLFASHALGLIVMKNMTTKACRAYILEP